MAGDDHGGCREIAAAMGGRDGDLLCTPCGNCHRLREFAKPSTPVHVAGAEGVRRSFTLEELLPASFGPDNLDKT